VALSGWGQDEDRRKTRAAGFDAHLVKPVDVDALMALIAGVPDDRGQPPAGSNRETQP
jgi:CheY-like chemotaxis protein